MTDSHLLILLNELVKQPLECERVEFKLNYHFAEETKKATTVKEIEMLE